MSADGFAVLKEKIEKVENSEAPATKTQLRSLFGITGYYRRFVRNFRQIAKPLTNILRDTPERRDALLVTWEIEYQSVFEKLKTGLVRAPMLATSDYNQPFIAVDDASSDAVGQFCRKFAVMKNTRYTSIQGF